MPSQMISHAFAKVAAVVPTPQLREGDSGGGGGGDGDGGSVVGG